MPKSLLEMVGTTDSVLDLLKATDKAIERLNDLEVVTTRNKPLGDFAEWLVNKCFGLTPAPVGKKGYDATGDNGKRYQIKACRPDKSPKFSPLRQINDCDFVIAVVFNDDYSVRSAVLIPRRAFKRVAPNNGNIQWNTIRKPAADDGLKDITRKLQDWWRLKFPEA